MKSCEYFTELISVYIDGELDPVLESELFAHIQHCEKCCATLDFYRRLSTLSAQLKIDAPPSLSQNVMRSIRKQKSGWTRFIPQTVTLAAAAIALVVAAQSGIFSDFFRNTQEQDLLPPQTIMQQSLTSTEPTGVGDVTQSAGGYDNDYDSGVIESDADADKQIDILSVTDDISTVESGENFKAVQPELTDGDAVIMPEPIILAGAENEPASDVVFIDEVTEPEQRIDNGAVNASDNLSDDSTPQEDVIPSHNPMMRMFMLPLVPQMWDDNGNIDITLAGDVSYIVMAEGDNSHVMDDATEIGNFALWLKSLSLVHNDRLCVEGELLVEYVVNYADGSLTSFMYAPELGYIMCDDAWYSIDEPSYDSDETGETLEGIEPVKGDDINGDGTAGINDGAQNEVESKLDAPDGEST